MPEVACVPSPPTFELVDGGGAIRCLICGRTSHHPDDVRYRYCGACNVSHDLLAWLARAEALEGARAS